MLLTVKDNTVFKSKAIQSSELADDQKVSAPIGKYELTSYEDKGDHLLIQLAQPFAGKIDWYVFEGHVLLLELPTLKPNTDTVEPKKGGGLNLPGKKVGLLESIIPNGHFSWAEATKNGSRIPVDLATVSNIEKTAVALEKLRSDFGDRSISVNSWYRDPRTNRAVGGASKSTHLVGYAVDINIAGFSPKEVQRKLDNSWRGGLGYGSGFTHLDLRNYNARWDYGS